ncbi:sugar transferase [Ruegeria arenilitoris]|uniref:sugar transferase n=1 Tax=Ruegeria arenilitoris TaxID=1173585 RepID=UPI001480A6A5|nr:sugar transferase [Ruegeria arenilitoris]
MFDFNFSDGDSSESAVQRPSSPGAAHGVFFRIAKRVFDLLISVVFLLPLAVLCGIVLLILNPIWNKGPLFFAQERMGRNCKPFIAYKFRSMRPAPKIERSADCPLEEDRITPLGRFLRKTRLDELPQIINVFKGDMSLVGPRPDYIEHARKYLSEVPGYQERHDVRPGISGWAQVELGYIEGTDATRRKVQADLYYIANSGPAMEARIVWRTVSVMLRRGGA